MNCINCKKTYAPEFFTNKEKKTFKSCLDCRKTYINKLNDDLEKQSKKNVIRVKLFNMLMNFITKVEIIQIANNVEWHMLQI